MRLTDIETFCTIVSEGSISAAATRMFLAQSTVSQRLDRLEQELGVHLLVRNAGSKNILLTPKGEALLPLAKNLLSVSSEINTISKQDLPISLVLGSITSIHDSVLPELITAITEDAPTLRLSTEARTTYDLYSRVENRKINYAFVSFELQSPIIRCIPIFSEEYKFICCKGAYSVNGSVDVHDFDDSLELYYSWCTDFRVWHDSIFSKNSTHFVHVDTLAAFSQCLIGSNLWTICPTTAIRYLQSFNIPIEIHDIINPPPHRTVYLIGRNSSFEGTDVSDLIFKKSFLRFYHALSEDILYENGSIASYPFF